MKIIMLIVGLSLASTTYGITLVLSNGYEIPGVTANGMNNSDYQQSATDEYMTSYNSKTSNRKIVFSKTKSQDGELLMSDNRDTLYPHYTGIQIVDGKIKSQITCSPNQNGIIVANECYVANEEVCSALLAESKQKSFADLENTVNNCTDILNSYYKALTHSEVSASIKAAYTAQNNSISTQTSDLQEVGKAFLYALSQTPASTPSPTLKGSTVTQQMTDTRVLGLVKICGGYTADKTFTIKSKKTDASPMPASSIFQ